MHTVTISKGNRDHVPFSCKDESQANPVESEHKRRSRDSQYWSRYRPEFEPRAEYRVSLCRASLCSPAPTAMTLLTPITRTHYRCVRPFCLYTYTMYDASRRSSFALSLYHDKNTPSYPPSPSSPLHPNVIEPLFLTRSTSFHARFLTLHTTLAATSTTQRAEAKTVDSAHPSISDPAGRAKVRLSASRTMAPQARSPSVG